ncbi:hypothetical protein NHX12_022041 [Muraenolepis orangiensis]|uniref:GDNF/GAS1 domain-containing protein n=1 Tax=Muraenolepis orangiensis TaxID=630683 RepID=A0A9Q0ESS0_9TELE|nr:hypothetical protein NHX12_022041 [Muraenolepis orangiensis]
MPLRSLSRHLCRTSPVAYDSGGPCLERVALCLRDEVCNRNLVPLLQTCGAKRCDRAQCRATALRFYARMPAPVADLLVMCECGPRDEGCRHVAATLHGGTCAADIWSCQAGVSHCLRDWSCRKRLNSFISKCWNTESEPCRDSFVNEECISRMNPALLLAGEAECRASFLALMGTPLQYPCTCEGLVERRRCDALSNILHNRSHFVGPWLKIGDSHKTLERSQSEGHTLVTVTTVILCKSG